MPTCLTTHEPSFDTTVYPFQMVFALSTSTPPSTLTLPCHQANFPSKDEVSRDSQAHAENSSLDVVNPSVNATRKGISQSRENVNSKPGPPGLGRPLPVFQEKPIYKRGKFKWATSFGQGPIDHPLFSPSDAGLSEGDVFIRVDMASSELSSPDRVQVWCSFTSPSTTCLIWRRTTVLEDIRVIGDVQYLLSLNKNMEPSWILARSAMDLHKVTKTKRFKRT